MSRTVTASRNCTRSVRCIELPAMNRCDWRRRRVHPSNMETLIDRLLRIGRHFDFYRAFVTCGAARVYGETDSSRLRSIYERTMARGARVVGGQNRVIRGCLRIGSSSHTLHLTTREVRALKSRVEADRS